MPALKDLTNQIFDTWKVISKLPSKNGKTYWLCECQICHKQKEIQGTHLRNNTMSKCCLQTVKKCEICGKDFIPLTRGTKRKFCFNCSPSYTSNRGSNITAIRKSIKKQLIEYKGGKCEKCGYNKSLRALEFHHNNPKEKDFEVSNKLSLGNFDMKKYYNEVDKCTLLCANCHAEEHDKNFKD